MIECRTFIAVREIKEMLCVSESKAYSIVRDLNKELEEKGYLVIPGRVSRKYFEERFYGVEQDTVKEVISLWVIGNQQVIINIYCNIILFLYASIERNY